MFLDESRISLSLATAEFTEEQDGTRLLFTEQGAFLDGHEMPARRDMGMGSLLDALGTELQSDQAATRPTDRRTATWGRRIRLARGHAPARPLLPATRQASP
jgi:hypothetical protein